MFISTVCWNLIDSIRFSTSEMFPLVIYHPPPFLTAGQVFFYPNFPPNITLLTAKEFFLNHVSPKDLFPSRNRLVSGSFGLRVLFYSRSSSPYLDLHCFLSAAISLLHCELRKLRPENTFLSSYFFLLLSVIFN